MKFKSLIILFIILLSFFPVLSSTGMFAASSQAAVTDNIVQNNTITIVYEYHDGTWWMVGYDENGNKIFEIEDPRE